MKSASKQTEGRLLAQERSNLLYPNGIDNEVGIPEETMWRKLLSTYGRFGKKPMKRRTCKV